jgi:chemotaxis protein CheD
MTRSQRRSARLETLAEAGTIGEGMGAVPAPEGSGEIAVGLGRMVASADRGRVLSALGLGSCIGLVMTDAGAGVAGLAHIMLPAARDEAPLPGKYADTAVPALLDAVVSLGARRQHVLVKMAGGAEMFAVGSCARVRPLGERNAAAVRAAAAALRLDVAACDIGGATGRSLRVEVSGGRVTVRRVGDRVREL